MADAQVSWACDTVRLLHQLPSSSATALSMMYFSRLSQAEISARTGWSEPLVRNACAAGLLELGRMLEAQRLSPARAAPR